MHVLKKLMVVASLVAALTALPSSASAGCPDPENPCDPTPIPFPINICKIDPRC